MKRKKNDNPQVTIQCEDR